MKRHCGEQLGKYPQYYATRWDGKDGNEQTVEWSKYVKSVKNADFPAGLLELEALADLYHLRVAVCCPESGK
eukprot:6423898-Prorocentrum_lima.AAC.1